MKTQRFSLAVAVAALVFLFAFSAVALAAKPDWAGGGGGPGSGGGGGGDAVVIPDYGDLVKLYRDDWGVPILTPFERVPNPDPEAPDGSMVDAGLCQQPLYFESDTCSTGVPVVIGGENVVGVDPVTCAVLPEYAGCTQEVDFGRMSVARSPDSVLDSQLDDVIVKLSIADCLSLDPAGRLVASTVTDDVITASAVDSPGQNLAIYRQLMLEGDLGAPLPDGADILNTAARGLGAASDKGGDVNVDLLVYLNQILGLDKAEETYLEKICIEVREEVMGTVDTVEKCFLNYGGPPLRPDITIYGNNPGNYAYQRQDNFSTTEKSLPNPPYISDFADDTFQNGWFEVLGPDCDDINACYNFVTIHGPILDYTFNNGSPDSVPGGFTDGNIGGFAQAADDTRAVIDYMHSWPVPADYQTGWEGCEEDPTKTNYDLSISPQSGLQVPVRMVATTEGREFIVSVANAGPDTASGVVLVTAVTTYNEFTNVVEIPPEGSTGYWNAAEERFEFPIEELAAGFTDSWTVFFNIKDNRATTITWTATIDAEYDVNPNNNSVTAETTVMRSKGGGGGEE
jgi:hypothetical protein